MGSRSSSSTASNQTSNVTNDNISDVNDSLVYSDVGSVEITQTDFDAVDSAFNFGGEALAGILDFGSEVIGNQQIQLSDSLKSINAATGNNAVLNDELRNNTQKTALVVVGAVIVGYIAFRSFN
jgi:hypothetical protein